MFWGEGRNINNQYDKPVRLCADLILAKHSFSHLGYHDSNSVWFSAIDSVKTLAEFRGRRVSHYDLMVGDL